VYNLIHTNNFGGTKFKINYIWGYANKRGLNTTALENVAVSVACYRDSFTFLLTLLYIANLASSKATGFINEASSTAWEDASGIASADKMQPFLCTDWRYTGKQGQWKPEAGIYCTEQVPSIGRWETIRFRKSQPVTTAIDLLPCPCSWRSLCPSVRIMSVSEAGFSATSCLVT
jgi:hypothetical protein